MKTWLVVLGGLAAVAVLAGLAVVQRDTAGAIKTQHENELKSELQALNDFKTWHKTQQDKPDPTIARVFVSKGIIDGLLASFDGMVVPIPNAEGIKLTVKTIRSDFRPGFPGLSLSATADKSGVKADVQTVARIEPQLDAGVLKLRVHVDSLVPKVSWRFLDFTLGGMVKDILQTRLVDDINKAEALGSVSIPITQTSAINTAATQVPFKVTGVSGVIEVPAYSASGKVTLSRILAMPEGLYIYANVQHGG
ncbi:hypothetical protein [Rhizobium sp. 42MFCr.1]|uniref:hypothetical protein n=1 Tax=Rhizobium sp. 42MFCr.1 TaxID=1048680 RepID=UPI000478544B|nr:hypothetical protein [Rhizobium sp. 42MFCr.1]